MIRSKTRRSRLLLLVIALAVLAWRQWGPDASTGGGAGAEALERAYQQRQSDVMLEVEATVDRILADDEEGRRHQRFIIALPGGRTVLVAHNIDLAPRVPLAAGDAVTVRGEYEWNEKGGVLHWTHHDPDGRHDPGWIEHAGRRYQ